jgi:ketosteroid isomerase-like protein
MTHRRWQAIWEMDMTALDVVRQALAVTDLEGFVKLWDPDGVWTHSGHSQISGPHSGHWEIAEMVRIALEASGGTLKAQQIELVAAGENSVLGYFQIDASRPGATIHQHAFQRWVVENGKVVSLDTVYCDQDEFDEFFQ